MNCLQLAVYAVNLIQKQYEIVLHGSCTSTYFYIDNIHSGSDSAAQERVSGSDGFKVKKERGT
jgi:hypothetical protein